jgi:hypothetical protein
MKAVLILGVLFITSSLSALAAPCKGQIVVEWTNNAIADPLVSELLDKAEHKAIKDGYCVTHFDWYNSLGHENTEAQIELITRLKDVPVAVYEFRSLPITKTSSIIVSQTRWCPKGYSPIEMALLDGSIKRHDFEVAQFNAEEMNYGEPMGVVGWANNLENAFDMFNALFGTKK